MFVRNDQAYVMTGNGERINFNLALAQMDEKIKERLVNNSTPCSHQKFILEYEMYHSEILGEEIQWDFSYDATHNIAQ